MGTYLFFPDNYVNQHALLHGASYTRYLLAVQNAVHSQIADNTVLLVYMEYYEAEFYLPIYTKKENYISLNARSPPLVYAEV
jgi:hypothetical protein